MKTAVSLPDDVFSEAERLARELGIPRSRLYADALAEYIRKHHATTLTAELDAVYSEQPSQLQPGLGEAGRRMLRDTEW